MKRNHFTDYFKQGISFGAQTVLLLFLLFFYQNNGVAQGCTPSCTSTNISIEGPSDDCQAEVTLGMVATFSPGCGATYRINLRPTMTGPILETVDNGVLVVDGYSISGTNYDYIGKHLVIEVIDLTSTNRCWNWHLFEDKLPPAITCETDTVPCYVNYQFAGVDVNDCSGPVQVFTLDESITDLDCSEENLGFLKRIIRTYYAQDAAGNKSDTCTDTIILERPDGDSINFPRMDTVYCDQVYQKDAAGHPHPNVTGIPTIGLGKYALWPAGINVCGLFTDYTDRVINLGCDVKIMRTWNVNEWYCGTDYLYDGVQIILIRDTTPPALTVPADVTVNTGNNTCSANFTVPAATATDNCAANLNWKVNYPGGFKNQNGGFTINLPVGAHTIIYTVNDGCVNQSVDSMHVTVRDDVAPNVICIQATVATIPNGSEYVRVPAASFDDGSWDNCGPVTLKVRRMVPDCNGDNFSQAIAPGYDYLDFYCCDITTEPIVVILRVIDASGNYGECMVNIRIQDKTPPRITCPPDFSLSCNYAYDELDIYDLGKTFGRIITDGSPSRYGVVNTDSEVYYRDSIDGRATDNCGVTITETDEIDSSDCGIRLIVRTFTATDPFGNTASCTQRIHIYRSPLYLDIENFRAPHDTIIINGACAVDDLSPDALGDFYRPIYLDESVSRCYNLAYSYRDELYQIVDGACFKILRYWTVIDWCYAAEYGIDAALETAVRYTQTIKVMNNIPPVLPVIADFTLCSNDLTCLSERLDISTSATDDCTPANLIRYQYRIDLNYSASGVATWDYTGNGNHINQELPLGVHRVCFYATDGCSNVAESCFTITVKNCKKPTPVAHMLVTEIMPSSGSITLPVRYFNAGSFSACGGKIRLSFSSDVNDTLRTFTCDDIGNNPPASVEFWVTDQWGNQDYVVVTIIIQDNNNVCDTTLLSKLSGNILTTPGSQGIPRIDVSAGSNMSTRTSAEGQYKFGSIQFGNTYQVKPHSELNPQNGVETGDIIKIQNHILGRKQLDDAYKMIAADVTMDNEIKGTDIVEIRKLILGKTDKFASGLSWRFVDKSYTFPNGNPFTTAFPEAITVVPNTSVNNIDFYGVKLGDVNGNVTLNFNDKPIEIRSDKQVTFTAQDQIIPANVPTTIELNVDQLNDIEGFQMALQAAPGVNITGMSSRNIDFTDDNYNTIENNTRMSWNSNGSSTQSGSVMVTLVSDKTIRLSEAINVNDTELKGIGYGKDDSEYGVELRFAETGNHGVVVYQNRPNPFSGETVISFSLPEQLDVTVRVYDLNGKVVFNKVRTYAAGENELRLEASDLSGSGVFIYEVSTKYGTEMKRMIRLQN
ncbi:MAG TPA: T9SS type A sorting domain-containing protein [Saprospiraceae bacterium]|nr:T9SS type A sorting domain-containing protein [Saprospiraceae bacterium]